MFNQGISKVGDLIDIGVNQNIIKKAGAFYSYGETRLGQGRENSKNFLLEHSEISDEIEALIRGDEDPVDGEAHGHLNGTAAGDAAAAAYVADPNSCQPELTAPTCAPAAPQPFNRMCT